MTYKLNSATNISNKNHPLRFQPFGDNVLCFYNLFDDKLFHRLSFTPLNIITVRPIIIQRPETHQFCQNPELTKNQAKVL